MSRIQRLDEEVAMKIAAGEVVERPVSVVKELIENSIDAGAADIRITLEQGGKASIVIEDDGCGIAFDDLEMAMERYATSKIRSMSDLEHVATLGYRGEAISSIAAVSRMEIRTRRAEDAEGGMITAEGGVLSSPVRIPAQHGTRVRADDLFFNTPARRKFLKSPTAELKRVIAITEDYSLVRPEIRYRLTNDGRALLDIGGVRTTDEAIAALWGDESRTVRADGTSGSTAVRLWWNVMPGSRRANVIVFVNGRRVQDPTVRSALFSTGSVVNGEWVVMISMPPEDVDVNIHPAKAEVRFRASSAVFEAVRRAAEQAIREAGGFGTSGDAPDRARGETPIGDSLNFPDISYPESDKKRFSPAQPSEPEAAPAAAGVAERELFTSADAPMSSRRFLGSAQGGYLVFDDPRGLCLLDPHAAHERILYEQIEESYSGRSVDTQRLLEPQEIPPALCASVELHRDLLRGMGFTFALPSDGPGSPSEPVMKSLPALRGLGRLSPMEMLRSALKGIEEETDSSKRDREVWWRWARTACRDAVKLGAEFSSGEALDLFAKLEKCRTPYSCPHGRPTTIFLDGKRLKSWFER